MKTLPLTSIALLIILLSACQKDDDQSSFTALDNDLTLQLQQAAPNGLLSYFMLPNDQEYHKIPQDPNNQITLAKVTLGKLLFHETGLALNPVHVENKANYSCASCHFASAGFQAGRHQAIADGGIGFGLNGEGRMPNPLYDLSELDVQPLRSPSALNSAYQKVNLWNGQFGATGPNTGTESQWASDTPVENNHLGYEGVETQAIAALTVHRLDMNESVSQELGYRSLFDQAFPDATLQERYNKLHAGLAIAAYERTLLPNQAPFQKWLQGAKDAMTQQEKRGAALFFGKAKCSSCHNGPNLANMDFKAIGVKDLDETLEASYGVDSESEAHLGRYSFTKVEADKYKFKIPQLYNIADSPFYGHGSSFRSIRDIISYKNKAVKENPDVPDSQLAEEFRPLGLTETEVGDITAFIENALRDPYLMRYQPSDVESGNCIPNNDITSREDLGCN